MIPPTRAFCPPTLPPYFERLVAHAPGVERAVGGAFPALCPGIVAEAVQDSLLDAWLRPAEWGEVYEQHGDARLRGWFRVAAWRRARGWWRQYGSRRVPTTDDGVGPEIGVEAAQAFVVELLHDLAPAVEIALDEALAADRDALRRAVRDLLVTGDSDVDVARRNGVRREYVNRARRALRRELLD